MKKILLACLFVLSGTMAFAQFSGSKSGSATTTNGWSSLRVSYGFNSSSWKNTERGNSTTSGSELTLAWAKGISLSKSLPIFLELGPEVSWITESDKDMDKKTDLGDKYNQLSLNIPINVGYLIQANDDISIFPYVGLKPKFNVMEKTSGERYDDWDDTKEEYTLNFFDEEMEFDDKAFGNRLQLGLQLGCSVNYQKFHFGLSYGTDLTNAAYAEEEYHKDKFEMSLKNSSVRLTVGYNF